MRDRVTDSDRAFAAAVEASTPAIPAPDYMEMMLKTRAMAEEQEQAERKTSARPSRFPRMLRRSLLVAGALVLIIALSAILSVTMPPPSASADSWFDRAVIALRNAFQVGTSPGEIRDLSDAEPRTYASVEDARADGYTGYAPAYLPQGFAVEQVSVTQTGRGVSAVFMIASDGKIITLKYDKGQNTQILATQDETAINTPFQWNEFYGVIAEHDNGILFLSCANADTDEGIFISGDLSADHAQRIVHGMGQ